MEIEIRAKVNNLTKLRKRLRELGARYIGEKMENDKYLSSIELCRKLGYSFVVRVREREGKFILTVKSAKRKIDGVWEEYEVPIKEPKTYLSMFKLMGFKKVIEIKKKRETFKLKRFIINLDIFPKWGVFVEFEIMSQDIKDKKKLFNLAKILGIKKKDIFEKGYLSLFLKELNSPFARYIKN